MADTRAGQLALEALATLTTAMTRLEVGDIGVLSFGETVRLLHPLDSPFTDAAGAKVVSQFTFAQKKTNMARSLETLVGVLDVARAANGGGGSGVGGKVELSQLVFMISDGRFEQEARERVRRWVRTAEQQGQLLVLLIVDSPDANNSILNTKRISYTNGKMVMSRYLEDYPFPLYLVLRDIAGLPEALSDSMRQWFELLRRG
jgi:midasin